MLLQVKDVAELSGVSIRTLHYYDTIGLLQPAQKSPAGYRLYTDEDLARLQQILFFRELGFPLREIKEILDRPGFDRRQALLHHRQALLERQERLTRLIRSIDRTLASMERSTAMAGKEKEMDAKAMDVKAMKELFDGFDPTEYEEEVRQRWGHTQAYKESLERTQKYTRADWESIKREGSEIESRLASLMDRDPSDPEVQEWIGRHHKLFNDRFYTCPLSVYRGLGNMYAEDPRFAAYYEKIKPGMARFMQAAINAYCDRLESDQLSNE